MQYFVCLFSFIPLFVDIKKAYSKTSVNSELLLKSHLLFDHCLLHDLFSGRISLVNVGHINALIDYII